MSKIKAKITLLSRGLNIALLTLFIYSCNGQKTKDTTKGKPETQKKSTTKNGFPFFYNQKSENAKQHATFNGRISEFVWQIFQDKNTNYWFATNHDGVLIYNHTLLRQFTPKEGIGGNAVRAIVEDKKGTIWLGTSNGLTSYDGKTFKNYTTKDGLINNEIWTVKIAKNGTLWIGTVGGVSKFNGTKFESFNIPKPQVLSPESMLSKNRISDILIDKNNDLWFVNDGYGITKFNGTEFTFFTTKNGLTNNNVADLFEDSQGNIWIGTYYGGVSKYDGKSFTNFTKDGIIKGVETYNFCEDSKGNIWFSAENYGVYRYDGKEFTQFTMKDGLATNTIQSIFQDKKGQIWFSTWNGLSLYNGKTITNAANNEPWVR